MKGLGRSRVWPWLLLAFALFLIVRSPQHAAVLARHLGTGLAAVASGLSEFINALSGGD